jgi:dipeptide/tripeptide permease
LDGGVKCPACGQIIFWKFSSRRDPVNMYMLLGSVAAFVVALYFAGQFGTRLAFKIAAAVGVVGLLAQVIVASIRAVTRSHSVPSRAPEDIRRRRQRLIAALFYLACAALFFVTRWLDTGIVYGQLALIVGFVISIVMSANRESRTTARENKKGRV